MRGMGNMQGMMKQVQKLQKEMTEAQENLHQKEFTGVATNELVTIVLTGDKQVKDLQIKPEVIDPEDPEMLQDLLIVAMNDALTKIDNETEKTMGKYAKGLPGMF